MLYNCPKHGEIEVRVGTTNQPVCPKCFCEEVVKFSHEGKGAGSMLVDELGYPILWRPYIPLQVTPTIFAKNEQLPVTVEIYTDNDYEIVKCKHCNGEGDDGVGYEARICRFCKGTGFVSCKNVKVKENSKDIFKIPVEEKG
jgi:hypothetical protein